jgi:putative transposase
VPRRLIPGSAGVVFHVMNRATRGQVLFDGPADYDAFENLMATGQRRTPLPLLAYCLMPNHWHMVVQPALDHQLREFVGWVTTMHARRIHRCRATIGAGAVYKGRYHAVPVDSERYFYQVIQYVELNPVKPGLASRPDEWRWSSASRARHHNGIVLAEWPLPRPAGWIDQLNAGCPTRDLEFIRTCVFDRQPISNRYVSVADLAVPTPIGVADLSTMRK